MTEDEFRNGPAKMLPLESFSDKPNQPDHINPLGLSDRALEEARRLNARMANRNALADGMSLLAEAGKGAKLSGNVVPVDPDVRGPMIRLTIPDEGDVWVRADMIESVRADGTACIVCAAGSSGGCWDISLSVDEVLSLIERAAVMK